LNFIVIIETFYDNRKLFFKIRIAVIFLETERGDLNEQKKKRNIEYAKKKRDKLISFTFNTYSNKILNNVKQCFKVLLLFTDHLALDMTQFSVADTVGVWYPPF
jgi:hypothetical protein